MSKKQIAYLSSPVSQIVQCETHDDYRNQYYSDYDTPEFVRDPGQDLIRDEHG